MLLMQRSKSVKEYAHVFKKLVRHCELDESPALVIFRFVRGLNQDVSKSLKSCDYLTLEEAIWEASRAERSLTDAKEEERIKQLCVVILNTSLENHDDQGCKIEGVMLFMIKFHW